MDESRLVKLKGDLTRGSVAVKTEDGKEFTLTSELVSIVRRTRKQSIRQFTPHVLESALGFGRILYCLLEHSFSCRKQDIQRGVLSLPPIVAPTKVFIVPLSAREDFDPLVEEIASKMRKSGVVPYVDDSSASIGKRYARNDELGTPFGITVDFASIQNRTVTLRERDTMGQRIGNVDLVAAMVAELANGTVDWEEACRRLPKYEGVQAVE
ncbi:glycyl-tRNA synthetase [Coprinopsis cinerea AmutBmut pab1-1]|nr:glycyl-tRNA synthetase [Coprinopsis cinerea AmutBmut pab1-1]